MISLFIQKKKKNVIGRKLNLSYPKKKKKKKICKLLSAMACLTSDLIYFHYALFSCFCNGFYTCIDLSTISVDFVELLLYPYLDSK